MYISAAHIPQESNALCERLRRDHAAQEAELHRQLEAVKNSVLEKQKQLIELRTDHDRLVVLNLKLSQDSQMACIHYFSTNFIG